MHNAIVMKSKNEIIENASKFTAINAFIFAGSFSLGTMKAGFDLKKVLEISDTQLNENAFFFKKNVADVPVILPSEWENDQYLNDLGNEDIDLMCCNCPCSSLSQINRNASIDGKNNVHFYRLFNAFSHIKPKVFIVENAPTLVKLGYPIIKDMVSKLSSMYRFTVVRDMAGNHNVPMTRQRTLMFGWRKDIFKNIPIVKEDQHKIVTVKDTLSDMMNSTVDDFKSLTVGDISDLYKYAVPKHSLMTGLAIRWLNDGNSFRDMLKDRLKDSRHLREVQRIADKIRSKKNYWDKSPYKLSDDERFPSFTSVTEYLHPHQDRTLNMKETARIMNYPDWYDFSDAKGECSIPVSQAMAQGVPVNFGRYAAAQARLALENKLSIINDNNVVLSFQQHSKHKMSTFTIDEVNAMKELDIKKDCRSLKD